MIWPKRRKVDRERELKVEMKKRQQDALARIESLVAEADVIQRRHDAGKPHPG